MVLFNISDSDATEGYRNIRGAPEGSLGADLREGLEEIWLRYEPYADTNFRKEFARQPDVRFWEMYLTARLLAARKKLVPRADLPRAQRDSGPDICIRKGRRKIWIEAIAPDPGDDANLDQVPDLFVDPADGLKDMPSRRQIELRITSALWTKVQAFQRYREKGMVDENDSCVVAVSASQFALEAAGEGLSYAVTAVYPFGEEYVAISSKTSECASLRHHYSSQIIRAGEDAIPRTAFQDQRFADISGLIWSRRSIGTFIGRADDLVFVHNQAARKPIPRRWIRWAEEFYPFDEGRKLRRKRRRK
jgi:hypothetical protein